MSTLGVLTLSNAEKPHQHLAFNIESPYGSYLLDRFQMTSRWPMTKNRRPWICTERILWGLTSFLIYKLTFVPTNLHSLLATWVKSLYQIVSHDFSSAIFVYKKMKLGHVCQVSEKILGGGGGGIEFLFHVKTCICSKTFAQLLATWIVRKWVPRRSFYLRHSLRLDIYRLVVLLFLLKTGLEAKYALTKYCLIYEQECSIRFKTQGLGLIKRELVVNQMA